MNRRKFLGRFGLGFLAVPFGFKAAKALKEPVEVITFPDDATTLAVDNFSTMATAAMFIPYNAQKTFHRNLINGTGTVALRKRGFHE